MSLQAGTHLGPYEILSLLGAGGMGEVWRARDTKLEREVAIKVLPEAFARDKERLLRFEREAKLLASLNHANIAQIYGFEAADDKKFLVLELVEGETLRERLKRGPLPVDEALEVGTQIAEALEAAHEKGIIHRDLKPGNVMVKADGTVKVLDFGLARAMAENSGSTSVGAESPTITADFTKPGVVLGTAPYMSPEQARGRPLDKRTDIWSFGVMLYECLTGSMLFHGETATDSMGAIMHRDPDWAALPADTPPTVQLLLRRCLTKDRKRRLHDIADARIELENALVDPTSASLGLAQASLDRQGRRAPSLGQVLVVGVMLAVVGLVVWFAKPQSGDSSSVVRLSVTLPDGQSLADGRFPLAVISPGGTRLAYVANAEGVSQLYLRHMHQQASIALANTTDAESPVFSPDGRWIAFYQQDELKKISVLGGPAETICSAPQLRGVDWGADDMLAYAPTRRSGIWLVPANGGNPEQLTDLGPDSGAASHRWPHILPDGRTVLFTHTDNEDDYTGARIEAVSIETGERKVIVKRASDARYVPTGHLVFVRGGVLMGAAFDPQRVEITGKEVPLQDVLTVDKSTGCGLYSFADNGVLVYISGGKIRGDSELVWVDRAGKMTSASQHHRIAIGQALSRDGARIAWVLGGRGYGPPDIWVLELGRDMLTRLTFDDGSEASPVWSPDGSWIYFYSDRVGGIPEIYRKKADGSGDAERLTNSNTTQGPRSISPDGLTLVYFENLQAGHEIMLLHLDEERSVEPFLETPFSEDYPAVSPDGTLIAYTSNETGTEEVYVRRFPSGTGRVKISPGLGAHPQWSYDGTELFYTNDGTEYYSVAIDTIDDVLIPGSPELMFKLPDDEYSDSFDVAPDGQRFLFGRLPEKERDGQNHPVVVVNWFKELRERMATVKGH